MRAVLQRVSEASVTVNGAQISRIGRGICVLLGISVDDTEKDIDYIVKKILNVRVFESGEGEERRMWQRSVKDLGLEIMCVSQFTLWGQTTKGNKPDFHLAMKSEQARAMYETFKKKLGEAYDPTKIKDGEFGAMMEVHIVNSGPVTLQISSSNDKTT
ncbi:uncharacterized protein VTP21DRAFT_4712 [Calcarisporiella thermophila]|uniref:uncharacterized protein n=1 Tax=Calcarisporiella thermophila TaxID=911321 RepID=UPI0037449F3B